PGRAGLRGRDSAVTPGAQRLTAPGADCIFRPGNLMSLSPGRQQEVVRANLATGTALICHRTLPYGSSPEVGEAVCRSFYDAFGDDVNVIRVMHRLGALHGDTGPHPGFTEIPAP
ncbi:MAG: hypothetical protein ACRDZY_08025, partial [Acidimicrobiales bacterium]